MNCRASNKRKLIPVPVQDESRRSSDSLPHFATASVRYAVDLRVHEALHLVAVYDITLPHCCR